MGSTPGMRLRSVLALVSLLVPAASIAQTPAAAIDLAGTESYVNLGTAPGLNAATFTLELWFRRDGAGRVVGTGSGGVNAAPLITKGRSESDNSNTDVNYFLGIDPVTRRLVADFEQGAAGTQPGKNHPISSATTIVNDRWYHAAVTYDGATWRVYIDGVLDASLLVNQPPRSDNIQPAAIGSALNSISVPSGYFDGAIDEVRIWDIARTAAEIQAGMNVEIASAPGLLGRWSFNEGTGTAVGDSSGNGRTGTVVGTYASWVAGAPFRSNQAPGGTLTAPANGATNVTVSPTLTASTSDADGDPLTVTFYAGTVPAAGTPEFTLAVIPDTQHYVMDPDRAGMFTTQTQWIVNNQASKNIVFVTHLGDVVEHGDLDPVEWTRADTSLQVLEAANMKWGLSPGNHDMDPGGIAINYDLFFPVSRFQGFSWYGGYLGKDPVDPVNRENKNNYQLFSAGGLDFIIIHLEYDIPAYSIAWADRILKQYPTRRAILSTHLFLHNAGVRPPWKWDRPNGNSAEAVWQQLVRTNCNIFLVLNGHYDGEANRTDLNACGQPVHQVLSDYQERTSGGDGWLRYMTFKPAENKIYVYTFSPTLNNGLGVFETDANSQFVLDYNMQGAVFAPIAIRNVAAGATASATWAGLVPGTSYDWYATIDDGLAQTVTAISRFSTAFGNRAPVANAQSVAVSPNTAKAIVLTASDLDNDPLTYSIVAGPTRGTLTGTGPNRTYTPNTGYLGADSFTFRVNDGQVNSNTATVSITVANQSPVANSQSVTAFESTPKAITLQATDPENAPLTYSIVTAPAHGALTGTGASRTYTPTSGYFGGDSFTFRASDGVNLSNIATVSITVTADDFTLSVTVAGTGSVTSTPAGISCSSGTCSGVFLRDAVVTLTAAAGADTTFAGWSGACTGTGSCAVTMNAPKSVTATFAANGRDLVVTSISDPPAMAAPGATFTATDTTRNDGALTTASSTTRFYLSADGVQDPSDIMFTGTRTVPGLAFQAVSTGVTTLMIPQTIPLGTYRLLACADDRLVVVELNETNNCRASNTSVQVARPDLTITAFANATAMATPGARFSVTDTVQNIGVIVAPATVNLYYLSLDTVRSPDDVLMLDNRSIGTLAPSATNSGSRTITVPLSTPLATYYLLACADGPVALPETEENNNCRAAETQVIVGWADLVTTALNNPPAMAAPAGKFAVADTVVNQGQITAVSTATAYYLSTDPLKDAADLLLTGTRSVVSLTPGATSLGGRDVTVPATTPLGVYYVIACADYTVKVTESNEVNNCLTAATTVQIAQPDLIVTAVGNPIATAAPGALITVSDTVQNVGQFQMDITSNQYYLSLDATRGAGDVLLTGARSVPILGPGAVSSGSRTVTIPTSAPAGVYFLLACGDDTFKRLESNETNNCLASATTIQIQ